MKLYLKIDDNNLITGEKIPENINLNVEMTKKFMELCVQHLGNEQEKMKCLNRMIKHF